jgi:hypothetical protein
MRVKLLEVSALRRRPVGVFVSLLAAFSAAKSARDSAARLADLVARLRLF